MKKYLFCLTVFFAITPAVIAQGLKGTEGIHQRFGQVQYVTGQTESERWKRFLKIQPKLIGLKKKQVIRSLGTGTQDSTGSKLTYLLSGSPVDSGLGKDTWLHIVINFRSGKVWKYAVEARD